MYAVLFTPLHVRQGDPYKERIEWVYHDDTPVSVAGLTGRMNVRRSPAATVLIELSTANHRMELNDGEIILSLSEAETAALTPGSYVFDLQTTDAAGVDDTLCVGKLIVEVDLTPGV